MVFASQISFGNFIFTSYFYFFFFLLTSFFPLSSPFPQLSEKSVFLHWFISTRVWKAQGIKLTNILLLHVINANAYREENTLLWFNFHSPVESQWFNFVEGSLSAYCLLRNHRSLRWKRPIKSFCYCRIVSYTIFLNIMPSFNEWRKAVSVNSFWGCT